LVGLVAAQLVQGLLQLATAEEEVSEQTGEDYGQRA
jgi:hypothetical protein